MTISTKVTVYDVLVSHSRVFQTIAPRLTEALKEWEVPERLNIKRLFGSKLVEVRNIHHVTMEAMQSIETYQDSEDYFFEVMRVATGLSKKAVYRLEFLRAFRVFMHVIEVLQQIRKAWDNLPKVPISSEQKASKVKRPERGLAPLVDSYCKLMNGSVSRSEAWSAKWEDVYIAFEEEAFKSIEQHKYNKLMEAKRKRK